jgi:hypothetical protein
MSVTVNGSLTTYAEQQILTGHAIPALKMALFTDDPGKSGTANAEISGNGYTRSATLSFGATTQVGTAPDTGTQIANNSPIVFPSSGQSTGAWNSSNPCNGWGLMDNSSNCWFHGTFSTAPTVSASGQTITIIVGALQLQLY